MAEDFTVRIEMRQIGSRQEASRLGGIGSCGRELCCSTWLTDFRTVSTSAARYQQLSLNPQKLAGQCGKLKCCLNYELDMYVEAYKDFPDSHIKLQTKLGNANHQKTDTFKKMMWYTVEGDPTNNFIGLKIERVKEIIELNKKGTIVDSLEGFVEKLVIEKQPDFDNVVGQDSLTRFDKPKNQHNKNKFNKGDKGKWQGNKGGGQQQSQQKWEHKPKSDAPKKEGETLKQVQSDTPPVKQNPNQKKWNPNQNKQQGQQQKKNENKWDPSKNKIKPSDPGSDK
jgi:hypothetical protein